LRKEEIMHVLIIMLAFIIFSPIGAAEASVDLGVSIGEEGLRGFYLAVENYYRVPEREVVVVRDRHIPDEEIPVVFFLAQRAHVRPSAIIDFRLAGRSWLDISLHFGLGPEIFYVPVRETVVVGPPYGKAYGYYKKKPKKQWRTIVLSDADVVNLVNLRFISDHYKYKPEKVMKLREGGKNFVAINDEVIKEKKGGKEKVKEKGESGKRGDGKEKNKGKEKGNGNGKGKGKK
jgi:hypothetical protein